MSVYNFACNRAQLLALWNSVDTNPEHPARLVLEAQESDGDVANHHLAEPGLRLARYNAKRLPALREKLAAGKGDAEALMREEVMLCAVIRYVFLASPLGSAEIAEAVGFPEDMPYNERMLRVGLRLPD